MDPKYEMIFGAVLIVIYATERFNTPATVRASTTAGRYHAAATIYLLIYLATFYVFSRYPEMLNHFDIEIAKVTEMGLNPGQSSTILIAVLLSLLVPKTPVISDIDTRLRRFLHRLAAIPYEAIRFSKELQHSRYEVPSSIREALADELEEQGFEHGTVDSQDPVIQRWVGICSLMVQLKSWDHSHQYAVFIQERAGQRERIKEHYARLSKMAQNAVALSEQIHAQPEVEVLRDAATKFCSNLQVEQSALLSEICDLISHGVLKTCFRDGARQKTVKDMGFVDAENQAAPALSVNHAVTLFGLLLALILANFILFREPHPNGERFLLMITMIASIYSAAVICAVIPKQRWTLFQYSEAGFYPGAGYLLSGVMAVMASMSIGLIFKTLIFANSTEVSDFAAAFAQAWDHYTSKSYPWLTMAFATTVSTSFLIDWRRPTWLPVRFHRVVDALLQAALLMAAATVVHWWLSSLSTTDGFDGRVPGLIDVLRTAGIVGFTLGLFVPSWYHRTSKNSQVRRESVEGQVSGGRSGLAT